MLWYFLFCYFRQFIKVILSGILAEAFMICLSNYTMVVRCIACQSYYTMVLKSNYTKNVTRWSVIIFKLCLSVLLHIGFKVLPKMGRNNFLNSRRQVLFVSLTKL